MKNISFSLILSLILLVSCQTTQQKHQDAPKHSNALVSESSPYLLQHAHNPVNWMPWGEEALNKAKEENKLLLISIGYSACHWCHVMERETFEDSLTAAFMNEHFISIKVDREERPDVDQIYMDAVQAMTGRGGWPLNCFALSDGRPIHGGTYFQKEEWLTIMESLINMEKESPEKLEVFADQLMKGLQNNALIPLPEKASLIDHEVWRSTVQNWKSDWDPLYGGPNRSPKFPIPNSLAFLLQFGVSENDPSAVEHVHLTLDNMAKGGIYDHVGGGFARYSTDKQWKAPHFEKMLYDNAQLIGLYSLAYRESKNPEYQRIVKESIDFLQREMNNGEGAFYAALDADSEGEEGKHYTWSNDEIEQLSPELQVKLKRFYEINAKGAWEHTHILLRSDNDRSAANNLKLSLEEYQKELSALNQALLKIRNERPKPGLDDKVLCSWNALLISGLCEASRSFANDEYASLATSCANFLWRELQNDALLKHSFKNGISKVDGHLDDYAYLAAAYIDLYQLTFNEEHLVKAVMLTEKAMELFREPDSPYFYFTSKQDSSLLLRKQEIQDNVIPSGNSTMAKNLFLLGSLYDRQDFQEASAEMLRGVVPMIDYGQNFSNWGMLGLWQKGPFYEVAITGPNAKAHRQEMDTHYLPQSLFLGGTSGTLPLLEGKFLGGDNIFVCQNKVCQFPVNNVDEALEHLP